MGYVYFLVCAKALWTAKHAGDSVVIDVIGT